MMVRVCFEDPPRYDKSCPVTISEFLKLQHAADKEMWVLVGWDWNSEKERFDYLWVKQKGEVHVE